MNTPKKLSIFGAGKLAQVYASLLKDNAGFEVLAFFLPEGRSPTLVDSLSRIPIVKEVSSMPDSDMYLIATPDAAIEEISDSISTELVLTDKIVFHASGALSSNVLRASKGAGARVASVHPLISIADVLKTISSFPGTFCALEGEASACSELAEFFQGTGARVFSVSSEQKALYHAAAVMASNYTVSLNHVAQGLFAEAGLSTELAQDVSVHLAESSLSNIANLGSVAALTGPVVRGDADTVASHLDGLGSDTDKSVYKALGQVACQISKQRGGDPEVIQRILNLLRMN